jgi:RimJ/RimL family protein N-acetyltransferase
MHLAPPAEPLSDGVVSLRLPSPEAGDVESVRIYSGEDGYGDECWLPLVPGAPPERSVADWLEGWAGRLSHNGRTLVVTVGDEKPLVGVVGFGERDEESLEMIVGVAPAWRGRGLGTRAVQLCAGWLLGLAGVSTVELRIDQHMPECRRLAEKAGFQLEGTVSQFVPGTGETFEDLRYVRRRSI